jgi:hypothetical protein
MVKRNSQPERLSPGAYQPSQAVELVIAAIAWTGLVLLVASTKRSAILRLLNYYTVQTNLMAACLFLYRGFRKRSAARWLDALTSSVVLWICVTGLGYHALLAAVYSPTGLAAVADLFIHTITPLCLLLYFLLISRPRVKGTAMWFTYPLLYVLATLMRGIIDGFYPYWFLTPFGRYPDGIGSYLNIVLLAFVMSIIYFSLGQLLWFLNKQSRMHLPIEGLLRNMVKL